MRAKNVVLASPTSERLESLLEVSALLNAQRDTSGVLRTIVELAARVAEAETASLLLVDETTGELYFDVALGLPAEIQKVRLKKGQGIAGWVASQTKPVLVPDVRTDSRWDPGFDKRSGFTTRSIVAVPMKSKAGVLGVIEVINKRRGLFGDQDRRVLEAFAAQAAIALENARLFASLEAEKRKFETVLAEMAEGAVLTDAQGVPSLANAAAGELLGGKEGRDLEQALSGFRVEPPLPKLLAGDAVQSFQAVRSAPKPLFLGGSVRPIAGGGRLWVFRDITEERREEALKQEFFSLISHKLKTPLVSIIGYCDVLAKDSGLGGNPLKAVGVMGQQARLLSSLVDKLLKFTWLHGAHAVGLKKENVSVDRLLRFAGRQFEEDVESGRLVIERGPGLEIEVQVDAKIASDALVYLIENALRFNTKPVKNVRVSAKRGAAQVEVVITDDGPGIPPEDRKRVFKRFYQVEEKFTGQVEGWGLGLPYVAQAMKAHSGAVKLDTKLGQGTTVILQFPIS